MNSGEFIWVELEIFFASFVWIQLIDLLGARKFVVVNFGRPVLLTDFILPQCSDLGSLSVDVWLKSETADGQRLVVCSDIGRKSFVVCDLQPPALCQFLKVNIHLIYVCLYLYFLINWNYILDNIHRTLRARFLLVEDFAWRFLRLHVFRAVASRFVVVVQQWRRSLRRMRGLVVGSDVGRELATTCGRFAVSLRFGVFILERLARATDPTVGGDQGSELRHFIERRL